MKTKKIFLSIFLMIFLGSCVIPEKVSAQNISVSFQVFYDELSPYGTWVDNAEYGYVWYPDVAIGFSPYSTNGYWVYTDYGWTWVSDYSWGWAPFHYGRWYVDYIYGPMWIPDNQWGPGWVSWRHSNGYYGWAPIGPGVNVSVAYSNDYNLPDDHWTFVKEHDFGKTDITNYYINTSNNATIISHSAVIKNVREDNARSVTYSGGPDRTEIEKFAGKKITPISIQESNQPGQNLNGKQLQIYKPVIQNNNYSKTVPSRVDNLNNVKKINQRSDKNPTQKNNQNPSKYQKSNPAGHNDGNNQKQENSKKNNNDSKKQKVKSNKSNNGSSQQKNTQTKPRKK